MQEKIENQEPIVNESEANADQYVLTYGSQEEEIKKAEAVLKLVKKFGIDFNGTLSNIKEDDFESLIGLYEKITEHVVSLAETSKTLYYAILSSAKRSDIKDILSHAGDEANLHKDLLDKDSKQARMRTTSAILGFMSGVAGIFTFVSQFIAEKYNPGAYIAGPVLTTAGLAAITPEFINMLTENSKRLKTLEATSFLSELATIKDYIEKFLTSVSQLLDNYMQTQGTTADADKIIAVDMNMANRLNMIGNAKMISSSPSKARNENQRSCV